MDDSNKDTLAHSSSVEKAPSHVEDGSTGVGTAVPKVHFNLFQTLGMNYSITASPLSIGVYTSLVIGLGGFPFYIWGLLFATVFQLITCVVIAELASAIPHSSGQCRTLLLIPLSR